MSLNHSKKEPNFEIYLATCEQACATLKFYILFGRYNNLQDGKNTRKDSRDH